MTDQQIIYLVVSIIAIVCIILFVIIRKNRNEKIITTRIDKTNQLIKLLGGFDNIVKHEFKGSRFKVELKDINVADKEAIQNLGATGIMEVNNTLQIILGKESQKLSEIVESIEKK